MTAVPCPHEPRPHDEHGDEERRTAVATRSGRRERRPRGDVGARTSPARRTGAPDDPAQTGPEDRTGGRGAPGTPTLALRVNVRFVSGEEGRALAAAQGRALVRLLTALGPIEVGQGDRREKGAR